MNSLPNNDVLYPLRTKKLARCSCGSRGHFDVGVGCPNPSCAYGGRFNDHDGTHWNDEQKVRREHPILLEAMSLLAEADVYISSSGKARFGDAMRRFREKYELMHAGGISAIPTQVLDKLKEMEKDAFGEKE